MGDSQVNWIRRLNDDKWCVTLLTNLFNSENIMLGGHIIIYVVNWRVLMMCCFVDSNVFGCAITVEFCLFWFCQRDNWVRRTASARHIFAIRSCNNERDYLDIEPRYSLQIYFRRSFGCAIWAAAAAHLALELCTIIIKKTFVYTNDVRKRNDGFCFKSSKLVL